MKPLVDKKFKLQKFSGKGGWTYAAIPEISQDSSQPFGWVKVKGSINGFPIKQCHLMPMGNKKVFLPVKSEIRKKIKKQEGDTVHIILFPDNDRVKVPDEMLECIADEPQALAFFNTLSESEKNFYVKWVYSAKKQDTKVDRLAKTIARLAKGLKMYDKAV